MRAYCAVTGRFFAQIWEDAMLAALLFVPLIMGVAFRFGVPALDAYLCARLGKAALLAPYYPVFDFLLCVMTPLMFTAAGAMVILDEADAGLARAISATPVGRTGYLASRVGVPALLATVYCVLVMTIFRLSEMRLGPMLLLALSAGALGVTVAFMVVAMAKNKVEGLAYTKLSGLFVLGLPVALFVPAPAKYLAAFVPTLWMTELAMGGGALNVLPSILTAALWALLFAKRFQRKQLR